MENTIFAFLVHAIILSDTVPVKAALRCPNCGQTPVPYPLSTEPSCGDQAYKIRCSEGTLWFDALNQSSYKITSINPSSQRLVLRAPGFVSHNSCISADFPSRGMWLDDVLPFNITDSNTILKMNCSLGVQQFPDYCTSSSGICQTYLTYNQEAAEACGSGTSMICCSYSPIPSIASSWFRIRVHEWKCSMYQSFVNLNPMLPVSEWPEPGVELQWAPPHEPVCRSQIDCRDLANSTCLPDPVRVGLRRCFCKEGLQWDFVNGTCQSVNKLHRRKSCKHCMIIAGVAIVMAAAVVGFFLVIFIRRRRERIESLRHISLGKALEHPKLQQQYR